MSSISGSEIVISLEDGKAHLRIGLNNLGSNGFSISCRLVDKNDGVCLGYLTLAAPLDDVEAELKTKCLSYLEEIANTIKSFKLPSCQ